MSQTLVLVPCAKLVSIELQSEFGPISPAMIPLDGRPAIHYIIDQYPDADFAVAVHEGGEDVNFYCERHVEHREVLVCDVGETKSLGETILNALKSLDVFPKRLVVNFADTAVPGIVTTGDAVYYSRQEDVYRWTTFTVDEDGLIDLMSEKDTEKSPEMGGQHVFVGVFCFDDPNCFFNLLAESVEGQNNIDSFYATLRKYCTHKCVTEACFLEADPWFDFGHLDTYYESRKQLSTVCRHFNAVEVDSVRGTIIKRSQNADKFIDEIRWYLKLPKQLQYIAPRVFQYDLDYASPSVELEFYGYPVLNDLYLYGNLDLGAWVRIFKSLERMLADMEQFQVIPSDKSILHQAIREMYETKTLDRIALYRNTPELEWAWASEVTVNGLEVLSLNDVCRILPELLVRARIYDLKNLCVIHGDLCFSNILYDQRNGIIRVIDPRGNFGGFDIYGDPYYDLCKLSHSIEGDYDFLVNGLFEVDLVASSITVDVHLNARQKAIKKLYRDRLIRHRGREVFLRIRLLESLLFLSMIPLHSDRPRSQQAFLARGLQLFTEIHKEIVGC